MGQMLEWARLGESADVTMAEEDKESEIMVIEISDSNVEEVTEGDVTKDEDGSQENRGAYEMFNDTIVVEDTIEIESSQEMSQEISRDDEETDGSEEESESEEEGRPKYFAGCPVHNHHTDTESMCPDDPPCVCLGEID